MPGKYFNDTHIEYAEPGTALPGTIPSAEEQLVEANQQAEGEAMSLVAASPARTLSG